MQFGKGKYKTEGGFNAIVARVKSTAGNWQLVGSVECPKTHCLVLHGWSICGESMSGNGAFNLKGDDCGNSETDAGTSPR